MIIVSFDPGKQASWARFNTKKPHLIEVGDVEQTGIGRLIRPCGIHIKDIISDADLVIVEEVSPQPREGVTSVFTFGMAFGSIITTIQSERKPLRTITPKQWSSLLRSKASDSTKEKKARAVAMVKELWPNTIDDLKRVSDHDRADAALMIKWFMEKGPGSDIEQG